MTDRDDLNRNRLKIRSKSGRNRAAKPYARPSEPQSGFFGRIKDYVASTWPFRILSGASNEEKRASSPNSNESPPIPTFADRIRETRRDLDDAVDVGEENERETTPEEARAPTRAIENERDRQPDRNETSPSERVRRHEEDRKIPSTRRFDRVRDKKERSNDSSAVPIRARPLERSTPNPFSLTPSSSSRSKRVLTERKRPPVAQKRPEFSVSTFVASQSPFQSSFYRGGTTYGGASATRPLSVKRRKLSPELNQERPVVKRIKPLFPTDDDTSHGNIGMSQTAKRILAALESASSPLEDARRIPQSVLFPSKSPVTFSLGSGLRRSRASAARRTLIKQDRLNLSLSSSRPPPVESLKIPLSTLRQTSKESSNLFPTPVHSPEEKISAKVPKTSTSGGGKMKSPKRTAHYASVRQEERNEDSDLPPAIPFPVASGGLPKFSLGSSKSAPVAAATKPPGISFQFSKPGEAGTGAKAKAKPSAGISFEFSKPKEASGLSTGSSKPVEPLSTFTQRKSAGEKSSIIPPLAFPNFVQERSTKNVSSSTKPRAEEKSVSAEAANEKPMNPPASSSLGFSSLLQKNSTKWECNTCLVKNAEELRECMACTTPREKQQTKKKQPLPPPPPPPAAVAATGFPNLKASMAGQWECSQCLVKNAKESNECKACSAPRKEKPKSDQPAATSLFPALQQPSDTWSCDTCLVKNEKDLAKCKACETPRKGIASTSTLGESSSTSSTTSGIKFGEGGGFKLGSFKLGGQSEAGSSAFSLVAKKSDDQSTGDEKTPAPVGFKLTGGVSLLKETSQAPGGFKLTTTVGNASEKGFSLLKANSEDSQHGGGRYKLDDEGDEKKTLGASRGFSLKPEASESFKPKEASGTATSEPETRSQLFAPITSESGPTTTSASKGGSSIGGFQLKSVSASQPMPTIAQLAASGQLTVESALKESRTTTPPAPALQLGSNAPQTTKSSPLNLASGGGFKLSVPGGEGTGAQSGGLKLGEKTGIQSRLGFQLGAVAPTTTSSEGAGASHGGGLKLGFPLTSASEKTAPQSSLGFKLTGAPPLSSAEVAGGGIKLGVPLNEKTGSPGFKLPVAPSKSFTDVAGGGIKLGIPLASFGEKTGAESGVGFKLGAPVTTSSQGQSAGFRLSVPQTLSNEKPNAKSSLGFTLDATRPAAGTSQLGLLFGSPQTTTTSTTTLSSSSGLNIQFGASAQQQGSAPPALVANKPASFSLTSDAKTSGTTSPGLFSFTGAKGNDSASFSLLKTAEQAKPSPFQFSAAKNANPAAPAPAQPSSIFGGSAEATASPGLFQFSSASQTQGSNLFNTNTNQSQAPPPPYSFTGNSSNPSTASPQIFQFGGSQSNSPAVAFGSTTSQPSSSSLLSDNPFKFPTQAPQPAAAAAAAAPSPFGNAASGGGFDFSKSSSASFAFGSGGGVGGGGGGVSPSVNPFSAGQASAPGRRIKKATRRLPRKQ